MQERIVRKLLGEDEHIRKCSLESVMDVSEDRSPRDPILPGLENPSEPRTGPRLNPGSSEESESIPSKTRGHRCHLYAHLGVR
jgi:hypothetical protein